MNEEEILEVAEILEDLVASTFHDFMWNAVEGNGKDGLYKLRDGDIRAIKDELIKLLKQ